MKVRKIFDLKIEQLSLSGYGEGVIFSSNAIEAENQIKRVSLPFSLPGDEASVVLFKKKKNIFQAQAVDWKVLSVERISPLCRHFGKCGGCLWQHMNYEKQLAQKEKVVHTLFESLLDPETVLHPIIPSSPWRYRNKMEFSFSSDKKGNRYLGLVLQGSRGLVFELQECHLIEEWASLVVQAVRGWWASSGALAYQCGRDEGSLRSLTLRGSHYTQDRMVILTVSGNPSYALNRSQLKGFVEAVLTALGGETEDRQISIFLRIQQIAKGKPTQFYEMLLYGKDHIRERLHIESANQEKKVIHLRISPSSFFQPNTLQAEKLYSRAIELANPSLNGVVLDLYCGTGTLGLCMASRVSKVIGIEISPESSLDARENALQNKLENIEIHTGDVGVVLRGLLSSIGAPPEVVMVDPPRCGLDAKALEHVVATRSERVVYISCNPVTQAANIASFKQLGYRLEALQPVDQFPQTAHIENIALLTR